MRKLIIVLFGLSLAAPAVYADNGHQLGQNYAQAQRRHCRHAKEHYRGSLPPGQQKKLERTGQLPPGQAKKLYQ